MAHADKEVEIKVPVGKVTFQKVEKRLREICKFIGKSNQKDTYYTPQHRNFLKPKVPCEWLSLRSRDGKTILNYKYWYEDRNGVHTHCDEYESVVERVDRLEKIFKALDVKVVVKVNKVRNKFLFKDELEIALDRVKELGYFVEIESLKDFGGVLETRKKVIGFAHFLGLDTSKDVPGGYAFALLKKKGLVKS